jgi:hypothetical protein
MRQDVSQPCGPPWPVAGLIQRLKLGCYHDGEELHRGLMGYDTE